MVKHAEAERVTNFYTTNDKRNVSWFCVGAVLVELRTYEHTNAHMTSLMSFIMKLHHGIFAKCIAYLMYQP